MMSRSLPTRILRLVSLAALLSLLAGVLGAGSGNAPGAATPAAPTTADGGRVIVLGFDGADARTIRELVAAQPGQYPTFEKLAGEGTFEPLGIEFPAESGVSWASLNSGQNPGKTGFPTFLRRHMSGSVVYPGFGHIELKDAPLESFDDTPVPLWSPGTLAAVAGGGAFLLVLLVVLALTRKVVPAVVVGLIAGGGAGWVGMSARGMLAESYPRTFNVVQVPSFWDVAAEAGVPTVALDAAEAFDYHSPAGARVLHGLGLPDARGQLGQWAVYTSDPGVFEREGKSTTTAGTEYRVDAYDGVIESKVVGPTNFWLREKLEKELAELKASGTVGGRLTELSVQLDQAKKEPLTLPLRVTLEGQSARVRIGDQEQSVPVGGWSDWYELTFEMNWLLKVKAITRVRLVSVEPTFEMFLDVLHVDPRDPPFWQAISSPPGFAGDLADSCGLYETYGWPTLTMPFKDGKISPEVLLEDVEFTTRWRERLTHEMLARDDWRSLTAIFSTTDRVQHMCYQYYDEKHPLHDPAVAGREMEFFGERIKISEAIPAIYRQMDRIVGDVLAKLRPDDTLFVVSDHGFHSFRRQVNLNNWLLENGYLALSPGLSKDSSKALKFIDWKGTRAYSVGLGFIYLNLEGREPRGIVDPGEADALLAEIKEKLLAATDEDGSHFVKDVYLTEEHHSGSALSIEPEIVLGFAPPYRVGWATSLGGLSTVDQEGLRVPGPVCSDNDSPWSGGHVSMALDEIAGVFLSNRKVTVPEGGVRALNIAPTVLSLLGVNRPGEMDLEALEVH
jgi:predicted AlkP superfamily phosphohydrolase/phosphomutase